MFYRGCNDVQVKVVVYGRQLICVLQQGTSEAFNLHFKAREDWHWNSSA